MHESEKWKQSHSVMSNSSWPHGLQPTRLLHLWDFPGKSTGVGCHCLLCAYKYIHMRFPQSKLWETDYTVPPAFFFTAGLFRAFYILVSTWNTKQENAIGNYFLNRLIHPTLFFLECPKGMWLLGRHVDQRLWVRERGREEQLSFTTMSRVRI